MARPRPAAAPRRLALAAAAVLFAACPAEPPPLPEVRVHVAPGLPGEALQALAARARLARVVLLPDPAEAEVAWLADPVAALALGPRLEAGSAPPQPDVPDGWRDPLGRFAPVGARAWVLVRRPRARLPVEPLGLSDLANPKLAPRVALGPPAAGLGPLAVATLSLAYGERSVRRFLQLLARNGAQLAASDEAARARVAAGGADVALVSSVEGAKGAASAAGLEVVYPDQSGRGAVAIPTAAALLRGASPAGRALAAWLAGPDAERLLVARAPGLLPLRAGVPVPVGVEPAQNLRTLPLDWELLPLEVARLGPPIAGWPEGPFGGRSPRPRSPPTPPGP